MLREEIKIQKIETMYNVKWIAGGSECDVYVTPDGKAVLKWYDNEDEARMAYANSLIAAKEGLAPPVWGLCGQCFYQAKVETIREKFSKQDAWSKMIAAQETLSAEIESCGWSIVHKDELGMRNVGWYDGHWVCLDWGPLSAKLLTGEADLSVFQPVKEMCL